MADKKKRYINYFDVVNQYDEAANEARVRARNAEIDYDRSRREYKRRREEGLKKSQENKKKDIPKKEYEEYRRKVIEAANDGTRKPSLFEKIEKTAADIGSTTLEGALVGAGLGAAGGAIGGPLSALTATGGAIVGSVAGLGKGIYDTISGNGPDPTAQLIENVAAIPGDITGATQWELNKIDEARNYNGIKTRQEYSLDSINKADAAYNKKHGIDSVNSKLNTSNPITDSLKSAEQKRTDEYKKLYLNSTDDSLKYDLSQQAMNNQFQTDLDDYAKNGKKPDGYGLFSNDYWADMSTRYLVNLNEAQRDTYIGQILRTKQDQADIDNYKKYLTEGKLILNYKDRIKLLSDYLANPANSNLKLNVQKLFGTTDYKQLQLVKKQTIDSYLDAKQNYDEDAINESVRKINDLAPSTWVGGISTGISHFLDNIITKHIDPDWMVSPVDEYDALRYNLYGISSNSKSNKDKLSLIGDYEKQRAQKVKDWIDGANVNQDRINELNKQHKVSDYYDYMDRNSKGFIFDSDTWMYKMPGLTGSSQSSWIKQLPGTLSSLANVGMMLIPGAGEVGLAGRATLLGVNAGGVASGISAGRDENYAELALNYKTRLQNSLQAKGLYDGFIAEGKIKMKKPNASEEDVWNSFMTGEWVSNNPDVLDQSINATKGLGALFQNDMAAVTTDELIDAAIRFTPVRSAMTSAKSIRAAHLMEKASNPIGPLAGVAEAATVASAKKLAGTKAGQKLVKGVQDKVKLITTLPKKLMSDKAAKKFEQIETKLAEGKLGLRNKALKSKAAEAYWDDVAKPSLKQLGKNVAKSTFSEGIEEGKQYMHGQEYAQGEYDNDSYKQLLNVDRLWRDSWDGTKSALVALGVPFGSPFMTDDELVENVRGGMLGGFFQTGAMSAAQTATTLINERYGKNGLYKAMMDLLAQGLLDKAAMRDAYLKAVQYSKDIAGGDARVNLVLRAFDSLLKLNEKYKENDPDKYMDPDFLNKQRDIFKTVQRLNNQFKLRTREEIEADKPTSKIGKALNKAKELLTGKEEAIGFNAKSLRDQIKKFGIEEGTDRYHLFMGIATMAMLEAEDSRKTSRDKDNELFRLLNEFATPFELREDGQVQVTQNQVIDGIRHSMSQLVKPESNEEGQILSGKLLLDRKNNIFRLNIYAFLQVAALQQLQEEINQAAANNVSIEGTKQDLSFINKRISAYLKNALQGLDSQWKDVVKDNARQMLLGIEGTEDLLKKMRSSYLSKFDNDYNESVLAGILGQYQKPENMSEDEEALDLTYSNINPNEIIDKIEEAIKGDKLLEQRVADDFDQQYQNRQDKTREIQKAQREAAILADNVAKQEKEDTDLQSYIPTIKARKGIFNNDRIYKAAYKITKKVKDAKDINEAIEILKKNGFGFAGNDQKIFGNRLDKLYTAYKEGKISRADFAKAFVPQEAREEVTLNEPGIIVDDNENPVPTRTPIERGKQMSAKQRRKQEKAQQERDERNRKSKMWDLVDTFILENIDTAGNDTLEENYATEAPKTAPVAPVPTAPVTPTPEPLADDAALQAAATKPVTDTEQLKAWDALTNHIISTDEKVVAVTGHDYFFREDGKLVMYTRVHGILDDLYKPNPQETAYKHSIIGRLKNTWDTKSLEGFKTDVAKLIKENEYKLREPVNVDPYFDYLEQSPEDIDSVIEAIADIIAFPMSGDAVSVGNVFDEICRIFFNEDEAVRNSLNYDTTVFNYRGVKTPISKYLSKDTYDKFLKELADWQQEFNDRGWKVSTRRARFYSTFYDKQQGKIVRICGETDMVAVDQKGHYHIIDFKTSSEPFYTRHLFSGEYNAFDDLNQVVTKQGRIKQRSTRQQYSMQQTMYYLMMLNNLGLNIDDASIFPIQVGYRMDVENNLIVAEKDEDKSIYNATNHDDKDKRQLISLQFVDDLIDRFQKDAPVIDNVIESIKESISENIDPIIEQIRQTITDYEGDITDTTINQFNELLNDLKSLLDYINNSDTVDYDTVFDRMSNLQSSVSFVQSLVNVDISIALKKRAAADEIASESKSEHKPIDESVEGLGENSILSEQAKLNNTFNLTYEQLRQYLRTLANGNTEGDVEITSEQEAQAVLLRNKLDALIGAYGAQLDPTQIERFKKTRKWMSDHLIVKEGQPVTPVQIPQVPIYDFVEGDLTWKSLTTTYKASIESSVALDGSGRMLKDVTGNSDFITKGFFLFTIKDEPRPNGRLKSTVQLHVVYNGIKYSPVDVHVGENTGFFKALRAALRVSNGKPVVPVFIERTNGKFKPSEESDTLINNHIITENQLWNIEFSEDQSQFGVTKIDTTIDGHNVVSVYTPGETATQRNAIYTYPVNNDSNPQAGLLVMMYTRDYDEVVGEKPKVPLNIMHQRLTEGDAKLIVDILIGKHTSRTDVYAESILDSEYEEGVGMGLTNRQVLNMLINYGNVGRKLREHVHLKYDAHNGGHVHIIGNVEGDPKLGEKGEELTADREFDLTSDAGRLAMIDFLTQHVDKHISWEFMQNRLLFNNNSENHPLNGLRRFVSGDGVGALMLRQKGKIQFGESSIIFDKDDFINPNNPSDDRGLSGLAWYIKHGFVHSNTDGMENTLLCFGNAVKVLESPIPEVKPLGTAEQTITQIGDEILKKPVRVNLEPEPEEVTFERVQKVRLKHFTEESVVKQHLIEIFGEQFVENGFHFELATLESVKNIHYAGLCTEDSITIYSDAEQGTEYHEAFHRVAEYILSNRDHEELYKAYRAKFPWKRSNKAVAEGLADSFKSYMNNQNKIKNGGIISRNFAKILNWVRMWYLGTNTKLLFQRIATGEFKNIKTTKEAKERAKKMFGDKIPMEIGGRKFKYITDYNIDPLVKGVTWMIFRSLNVDKLGRDVESKLSGENINAAAIRKLKYVLDALNDTGIFQKDHKLDEITKGCIEELLLNWDVLKDTVLVHISSFTSNYREVSNKENNEKSEHLTSDNKMQADDQKYDRSSDEFSQLDRASKKVKHMFSRIARMKYEWVDGKKKLQYEFNELGLPEYYSYKETLSIVLNQFHNCRTTEELIQQLDKWADEKPLYGQISKYLKELKNNAWGKEELNANEEGSLVEIMSLIHSHKEQLYQIRIDEHGNHIFESCDSEYNARENATKWSNGFAYGLCPFITQDESGKYTMAKGHTPQIFTNWFDYLFGLPNVANRRVGLNYCIGKMDLDKYTEEYNRYTKGGLNLPIDRFKLLYFKRNGKIVPIDLMSLEHVNIIKNNIVQMLNMFGITINRDMFDYMLVDKYGSADIYGLQGLFKDNEFSIRGFGDFLLSLTTKDKTGNLTLNIKDGKIPTLGNKTNIPVDNVFNQIAFIRELGNYEYKYRHKYANELSSLGMNNNRNYTITENNTITDYVDDLDRALSDGERSEYVQNLINFTYNLYTPESKEGEIKPDPIGSIILKQIERRRNEIELENEKISKIADEDQREKARLELERKRNNKKRVTISCINFAGLKTSAKDDYGTEYDKISKREDYISKCDMLSDGYMLFPTISDKKTWVVLDGVEIPGINYSDIYNQSLNVFTKNGPEFEMTQMNEVVDQLIEYAITEDKNIVKTINDIRGGRDKDGVYHHPMADELKVANYHKGSEISVIVGYNEDGSPKIETHTTINGARFFSLTGVYLDNGEYIDFNKTKELVRYDEQGRPIYKYVSEEENRETAYKYFFDKLVVGKDSNGNDIYETDAQQRERQRKLISNNLKHSLVDELRYAESMGLIERTATNPDNPLVFLYKNIGVNKTKLELLKKRVQEANKNKGYSAEEIESIALATYFNDINAKHIMSLQEVERIFSGHPGFYKCKWDDEGVLVDRTVDQHKRLGGLVSTGKNNLMEIPGIPLKYVCAEVDNEMVQSSAFTDIERLNEEGEIREAYTNMMFEKYNVTFDHNEQGSEKHPGFPQLMLNKSLDQIIQELESTEEGKTALSIARRNAKSKTDSFRMDDKHDGTDVADGASYITDEMCEHLLRMVGSWNNEIQEAFNILRGKSEYSNKDMLTIAKAYNKVYTAVIGAQKYSAYGFRMQNGVMVPYYNKMALFPLFECMATGGTAKILKKMHDQKIDMLMVNSAVKVGSQGSKPVKISDEQALNPEFNFNTYEEDFRNIRKQFNTDPKEDEDNRAMGTQMTKIALSALVPGRDYLVQDGINEDGTIKYKKMIASQVRDQIMDCINQISNLGKQEFDKQFKTKDGSLDMDKFGKFLRSELSSRGASRELIDGFQVVERNGRKEFKVPMVASANMNWLQSIIVAKINSHTVDIDLPGHAFIQRSVWGMEGKTILEGTDDIAQDLYEGRELKMVNEEGSMDCVLSIDFFQDIFDLNSKLKNASFKEKRAYLINHGIISGRDSKGVWHDATANIIGSRIPTQAISSIHALRCVDVLPIVRDTVVLPKEFTTITGSDFDIDKLYLNRLVYKRVPVEMKNEKTGEMEKHHQLTSEFEPGTANYFKNTLVRTYMSLLKDINVDKYNDDGTCETRSMHKLHASIDGDTKPLKSIVKDLCGSDTKPVKPYDAYTLRDAVKTKDEFMSGKQGLGAFALHNNNQVLTLMYGVEFAKGDNILTELDMTSLHRVVDIDGVPILSWLSGLINAHVDVAKDPYISKLNVNKFTWNMTALLIRIGMGKNTFYFLKQPIIEQLATAVNNADGTYMLDPDKSSYVRKQEAELNLILQFMNANVQKPYASYEEGIADFSSKLTKATGFSMVELAAEILKNKELLHALSKEYEDCKKSGETIDYSKKVKVTIKGNEYNLSKYVVQMLSYNAFTQLSTYAGALGNLVTYSKIDTKKQGKTLIEQQDYLKGYHHLFDSTSKHPSHLAFEHNGLYRLQHKSYVAIKTDNATVAFKDLMGRQLIEATPNFELNLGILCPEDVMDTQLRKILSQGLMHKIKSKFFFGDDGKSGYCDKWNIDPKSLVSGNNTLAHKLGKLKIAFINDPKYKGMLDPSGRCTNELLETLVSGYEYHDNPSLNIGLLNSHMGSIGTLAQTYDDVHFLKIPDFAEQDAIKADNLTSAWLDLLEDSAHPELQLFARELIVYAFITAGENGKNGLGKFIPNKWKISPDGAAYEDSYAYYMQDQLYRHQQGIATLSTDDYDDIIRNLWYENRVIPYANLKQFTPYYTGDIHYINPNTKQSMVSRISYPTILCGYTIKDGIIHTIDEDNPAPTYIRMRRAGTLDRNSSRRINLYRLFGYGNKTIKVDTGKKDSNGQTLYENKTVSIPIYVLVENKGNKFPQGYKITEYTRKDGTLSTNEPVMSLLYDKKLNEFKLLIDQMRESQGKEKINVSGVQGLLDYFANWLQSSNDFEQAVQFLKNNAGNSIGEIVEMYARFKIRPFEEEETPSMEQQMENLETTGLMLQTNPAYYEESVSQEDFESQYVYSAENHYINLAILYIDDHIKEVFGEYQSKLKDLEKYKALPFDFFFHRNLDMNKWIEEFKEDHKDLNPNVVVDEKHRMVYTYFLNFDNYLDRLKDTMINKVLAEFELIEDGIRKEASDIYNSSLDGFNLQINPKKREELFNQCVKRAVLTTMEELQEAFDFLDSLPKSKEDDMYIQCCIKWLKNDAIKLPRDNEKIRSLFDYARTHNVDLQQVNNPTLLILEEMSRNKISKNLKSVDVSQIQEFRYNRTVMIDDQEVQIYDVDDTPEGQLAVAQFLSDTAPIDSEGNPIAFSPWCLSTYNYNKATKKVSITESARGFWSNYNQGKRQIAVHNGAPVAFNSSSQSRDEWWDFNDGSKNDWEGFDDVAKIDLKSPESIYQRKQNSSKYVDIGSMSYYINGDGSIESVHGYSQINLTYDINQRYFCVYTPFIEITKLNSGNFEIILRPGKTRILNPSLKDQVKNQILAHLRNLFFNCNVDDFDIIKDIDFYLPKHTYKVGDKIYKQKYGSHINISINGNNLYDIISRHKQFFDQKPSLNINHKELLRIKTEMDSALEDIMNQLESQFESKFSEDLFEEIKPKKPRKPTIIRNSDPNDQAFNQEYNIVEELINNGHRNSIHLAERTLNLGGNSYGQSYNVDEEELNHLAEQAIVEEVGKLQLAARFNRLVKEPINQDLELILSGILREYNFDVIEDVIGSVFGKDVLGAFDFLLKIIYLANENDRNLLTYPEEFSHAFIKMMGAVYHKSENRHKYPETKLYSELRDLIEQTDLYKQTFERYKDRYKRKDGSIDYPAIKEETLGKALAVYLSEEYQKYKNDRPFFRKLKKWFNATINWFKNLIGKQSDMDKLDSKLTKLADSIIEGKYQKKYLDKINPKDFRQIGFDETIQKDLVENNGTGVEIMKYFSSKGCVISGSISYRQQGTLYRSEVDALHDFDIAVPLLIHGLHNGRPALSRSRNGYTQDMILEAIQRTPQANNFIQDVLNHYPNMNMIAAYSTGGVVITNWIICDDQSIIDRFKNMTGNFNSRLAQFTQEERDKITLVDLFFNGDNAVAEDAQDVDVNGENVKLANYKHSFSKKLAMSRAKDLYDYQQWKPFNRQPIAIQDGRSMFLLKQDDSVDLSSLKDLGKERIKNCGW